MPRDRKKTDYEHEAGAGISKEQARIGAGSNAGEVDPGVSGDDVTQPAGESEHENPDTDVTGTYFEPNAGRDLGIDDIDRGSPTEPDRS